MKAQIYNSGSISLHQKKKKKTEKRKRRNLIQPDRSLENKEERNKCEPMRAASEFMLEIPCFANAWAFVVRLP